MSLAFAPYGKPVIVTKINANEKIQRHLLNLGIVVGAEITSIYDNQGDVVLKVKDSRLAINKALAMKIIVA